MGGFNDNRPGWPVQGGYKHPTLKERIGEYIELLFIFLSGVGLAIVAWRLVAFLL